MNNTNVSASLKREHLFGWDLFKARFKTLKKTHHIIILGPDNV